MLTFLTTLLLSYSSWAVTVPPIYYPEGTSHEMIVLNPGNFGLGQYGSLPSQDAYYPYCNGLGWANFRVAFPNPNVSGDVKYYIEIYRVYFNPATGTPEFSTAISAPDAQRVYISSEYEVNSGSATFYHNTSILTEQNCYYFANVVSKRKVLGIWQFTWGQRYTNNINFVTGPGNTTASATLNTVSNVSMPSFYGPLTVGEFSPTAALLLNALPTTCEDRYGIDIEEFNLATWTGVSGTHYSTGWVMTQAPSAVNLSTAYTALYPTGFVYGKVYRIGLFAGPQWSAVNFFVTRKPAAVTATVNRQSYRTVTVFDRETDMATYYLVEKIPHCDAANLNITANYVTGYKVDIAQVSSTTMQIIPGTAVSSTWLTGTPPATYNLSALYNPPQFGGGKIYKVLLSYGDPMASKTFYIEFASCPRSMAWDGSMDVEEALAESNVEMEVLVFPNPGPGVFNLKFSTPVEGTVDVFDLNGRKVKQISLNGQQTQHEVDLTGYAKGIYVLQANVNGSQYVRKVILE